MQLENFDFQDKQYCQEFQKKKFLCNNYIFECFYYSWCLYFHSIFQVLYDDKSYVISMMQRIKLITSSDRINSEQIQLVLE